MNNKKTQNFLEKKFGQSGAKGKRGEDIVKEHVLKAFEESKIIDRTKDFIFQKKGIDFTLILKDGTSINFDVKNNAFKSNYDDSIYFAIEVEKDKKIGWFFTSQSDWIFHYCEKTNSIFYYEKEKLMNIILNNPDKFTISETKKGDRLIYLNSKNSFIREIIKWI